MNIDQAKALRLQQWRSTLDDYDFRMQTPEAHRATLRSVTKTLVTEGLIDYLQHFDINEVADAAYWHTVEERWNSPNRYRGSTSYDAVSVATVELPGTISRTVFEEATDEPSSPPLTPMMERCTRIRMVGRLFDWRRLKDHCFFIDDA